MHTAGYDDETLNPPFGPEEEIEEDIEEEDSEEGIHFDEVTEVRFPGEVGPMGDRRLCKIRCVKGKWVGPLCAISEGLKKKLVFIIHCICLTSFNHSIYIISKTKRQKGNNNNNIMNHNSTREDQHTKYQLNTYYKFFFSEMMLSSILLPFLHIQFRSSPFFTAI